MVKAKSCNKGFRSVPFKGEIGNNLSKGFDVNMVKPAKLKKIKEVKP